MPHAGSTVLRSWASRLPARVFTSNVDGQFQRAGFPDVAEVHGAIAHLQCSVPCGRQIWPADSPPVVDESTMRACPPLPTCPRCGAVARPNILMFGDGAWVPDRTSAQLESLSGWLAEHGAGLVVVELGAGLAVPTVRHQAQRCSRDGALIRINLREPDVPRPQDVGLALGARAALEELDALL